METVDYDYEPEHPHSRVAYVDSGSPAGGGLVDASAVASLSLDQRRSMMVLGPYGHIACGTHDAPVYYAGSDENRREMERLQETLERVGRRLIEWRRLGGFVVRVLAIVVLVGSPPVILGLTSENAPLLAWLVVIPTGPLTVLLAREPLRQLLASGPRPHKLVLR